MQVEASRAMVECSRVKWRQVKPWWSVESSRGMVECSTVKYR